MLRGRALGVLSILLGVLTCAAAVLRPVGTGDPLPAPPAAPPNGSPTATAPSTGAPAGGDPGNDR
ncbi:hypothetical protein GCM10009665_04330 [Kitasatospora nipponensis]|uniref:Uncharacterized protein n=1 Tax=Kitasatospora nipponensis TaxID=258049 RepID=A0ABN1VNG7_9ACTN